MTGEAIERWCSEQRAVVEISLIKSKRAGEVTLIRALRAPEIDLMRPWLQPPPALVPAG